MRNANRIGEAALILGELCASARNPNGTWRLDEGERIELVRAYHTRAGDRAPNEQAHAALHAAVETQAALGDELPVHRTIRRLMDEGLGRHDAVQAVASVLIQHLRDLLSDEAPGQTHAHDAYAAAVERLTAGRWRDQED